MSTKHNTQGRPKKDVLALRNLPTSWRSGDPTPPRASLGALWRSPIYDPCLSAGGAISHKTIQRSTGLPPSGGAVPYGGGVPSSLQSSSLTRSSSHSFCQPGSPFGEVGGGGSLARGPVDDEEDGHCALSVD
mmetsp:Transcript_23514/g.46980  ORF Transcript_23514/g.46980 Transcript_23514/m.46980 type:complete len:132 (-) Transcript_23514:359-754(-)